MKKLITILFLLVGTIVLAQGTDLSNDYELIEGKVIKWRREIHQNPELSNREFKTAEKIATHLKSLGIAVQTGVAHTGVVGILKGDQPGKVVALRADIDALPVTERNELAFKSTVIAEFLGEQQETEKAKARLLYYYPLEEEEEGAADETKGEEKSDKQQPPAEDSWIGYVS